MRGAHPPSPLCPPVIFGATKRVGTALALCGALVGFGGLPRKAIAQTPAPPSTLDGSTVKPELVVPANLPLELRGILIDERGSFFGFYNMKNGRSTWVALGKSMDGFVVRSHDEGSDWITAEFEGHVFTMALKKAPIGEVGVAATPVSPLPRAKENDAIRAEILNRKVLRLRAQKSRLKKVIEKNQYSVSPEAESPKEPAKE